MAANGGYSNRRGPDELMKDVGVSVAIVGDLAPAVAKSVVLHRVAANLGIWGWPAPCTWCWRRKLCPMAGSEDLLSPSLSRRWWNFQLRGDVLGASCLKDMWRMAL